MRSAILIIILLLVLVPHAAADAYVPTVYIQKTLNDLAANNTLFRLLFDYENQTKLNKSEVVAGIGVSTTDSMNRSSESNASFSNYSTNLLQLEMDAVNITIGGGIGVLTTNQMNKTASDNDTASRQNDTRHQALFDLLNATNTYFNLSLLNNHTFFNASLTGINLSLANNFSFINASLTGINVSLSSNFTFINASLVGINSTATDLQLQIKNNASLVNGTFVAMNNGSYVQTNNVSYVQVNNISYVQVNNGSYVQTNNVSYVQVNNASYIQTNNATYLQFPVGNLTYLFKLNATTCTGTDKSQFNGTNFICAADQTGASSGVGTGTTEEMNRSSASNATYTNATLAQQAINNTNINSTLALQATNNSNFNSSFKSQDTNNSNFNISFALQAVNNTYYQVLFDLYNLTFKTQDVNNTNMNTTTDSKLNRSQVWLNFSNGTSKILSYNSLTGIFDINLTACTGNSFYQSSDGKNFTCTAATGGVATSTNITWSQTNITNISKNYTVGATDATILVDSTKGSINISIPHYNISGRILTFKKVDASVGNMSVQSAHMFMGNESNTSSRPSVWQGQGAPKPGFNQTYFYSFNVTNMPFNISRISLHMNRTGTGSFNASLFNDTGGNKPYVQLDSTANTSAATPPNGGYVSATFNGTQLNLNTEYWIGLQLRNVSVYVGNATYEGVTVYNLTNNNTQGIMPHIANVTALNTTGEYRFLVPEIALNFSSIEGTNVMGTAVKYGTFRLQWDNDSLMQWWKV